MCPKTTWSSPMTQGVRVGIQQKARLLTKQTKQHIEGWEGWGPAGEKILRGPKGREGSKESCRGEICLIFF